MQGLVDNRLTNTTCEVGECIYCGERDALLTTEHAVPYGLNGPWTLLRASCEKCAKITTRFERDVMRHLWPDVRNVLAMQTRRKDKRSPTLSLEIHRDGVREVVQVPRTQFPTYLTAPLFPPPTIFWTSLLVPGVFANAQTTHLCGPTFEEASQQYPAANFVGMHLNFSPEAFARMVAKIGFCAGVAAIGLDAFTQTPIRGIILGTDPYVSRWVGSWWGEAINSAPEGLHQIRIMISEPNAVVHAFVRLFAQFGAPEHHVVLGPADPAYIASDKWPKQWASRDPSQLLYV